jgi:endonuclease/exonuclease/phosphatase family metal-dependent hydrolase
VRSALVLLLAVALLALPAAAAEPPRPLRVVTFNLFHGGASSGLLGDGEALEERLAMVTEELRALGPDVVALQEASIGLGRGNVAARVAEALGMRYVYAPATTRVFPVPLLNHIIVRAINFAEGSAVLSRFPIAGSEVYDLPRCAKKLDPRILLRADVRTPWGELAVFSTHVARDDCQVARVAEIVRAEARHRPAVVMGDFNAAETLPAITALDGDGFIDAFRAANPRGDGRTVWQRPWAPQATAHRRVDYILVAGAGADVACASRVILDRPRRLPDGRTLWPSDHYGVLADLRLFGIKCAP